MLSVEMLWSTRAAEFCQKLPNPSIPRKNLVIGRMQWACSRSAQCISFSRLFFHPLLFFQAYPVGGYSPLIASFPPLFTAGAGMRFVLFSPFNAIKYIPCRLFSWKGTRYSQGGNSGFRVASSLSWQLLRSRGFGCRAEMGSRFG